MQNLRDKLLKAGLVSEDQAKQAERGARPQRKAPAQPQPARELSAEERQRREAFAAREAEALEERRKEAARRQEARMQSERAHKLRALVTAHRIAGGGEQAFHYVKRSGKIGRLAVTREVQQQLQSGGAAVVDDPGQPEAAVVPAEAAKRVYEVDKAAIRFWLGPDKPIGFSDAGE